MAKRRLLYFGHLTKTEDSAEHMVMLRKADIRRKRGRPKMRWADLLKETTCYRLQDLRTVLNIRTIWRLSIHEAVIAWK